jgi:cytochrome P450
MCLLFLLAGYETTSTTLAYIMYEMAVNPEVQKKLQEEIDENFPDHVSIAYIVCYIMKNG